MMGFVQKERGMNFSNCIFYNTNALIASIAITSLIICDIIIAIVENN